MLTRRVTIHAIAAVGRNAWLQGRNSCMAEGAIATMGDINRGICCTARIMTAGACRPVVFLSSADGHVCGRDMVDTAVSRCLVGMTIETGGCCACSDHIDDRLRRAVMTGGAGTGAVCGHVMFGALY